MINDPNDDDEFKRMLAGIIGSGPAPYDVTTSMEQPAQQQLSAPYMPQSAPSGFGGYTPPPAAAPPQYLDHVQGHQFGAGDIAMLGGILAALIGGGKHRGEIAGSLAGQYGGAIMQNNARADARNQQVDQYNSQLAAKDDPLERWKAEQLAKSQAGNMQLRQRELDAQTARDQRIADHQALEDARDPVEQARLIEAARAGVDVDTAKKRADIQVDMQTKLAKILGKGQFAAPPAEKPKTPKQELDDAEAKAKLAGITAGTFNPLTGKPKDDEAKKRSPFADTEYENEELFNEKNSTAGNYQKNSETDLELSKGLAAMTRMRDLIKENGSQWGSDEKSAKLKGEFDTAKGVVQSSQAKLRALGVLQQREQEKVDAAIGADMGPGMSDITSRIGMGDLRVGRLEGAIESFQDMLNATRHANGLRGAKPKEKPIGESADGGIKYSVDTDAEKRFNAGASGKRAYTITMEDGSTDTEEYTEAEAAYVRGRPGVRSVQ